MWDDGIQSSTWRRANALAHDDGTLLVDFTFVDFTLWTTPDGNVCMYVCDHKETQDDGSGEGGLANIL